MTSIFHKRRSTTAIIEIVMVLLACAALIAMLPSGLDLRVYREGALALINDPTSLYDPILGRIHDPGLPFTYPPFAAFLFLPMAFVPVWLSLTLTIVASVLLTILIAQDLAQRITSKWPQVATYVTPLTLTSLFLISGPFRDTIGFGQINILIMGACYLTLVKSRTLTPFALAVGICAGIKLTPIALLLLPFAMRRWRAVLVGIAAFLGTQVAGLIFSTRNTIDYWSHVIHDPSRVGNVGFIDNLSIQGVLERLDASGTAWFIIAMIVGLGFAALLWVLHDRLDRAALLGLASTCSLLVSPVSWSHHWVWWPLMAYGWFCVATLLGKRSRMMLTGVSVASILVLGITTKMGVAAFGYHPSGELPAWTYILPAIPVLANLFCLGLGLQLVRSSPALANANTDVTAAPQEGN